MHGLHVWIIPEQERAMQEQTADFHIGYYIGVKEAHEKQEPELAGSGLLFHAVKAHHRASHAINLDLSQFLIGYASGYRSWYSGLISQQEV